MAERRGEKRCRAPVSRRKAFNVVVSFVCITARHLHLPRVFVCTHTLCYAQFAVSASQVGRRAARQAAASLMRRRLARRSRP